MILPVGFRLKKSFKKSLLACYWFYYVLLKSYKIDDRNDLLFPEEIGQGHHPSQGQVTPRH